jgi:hypothetical protein
VDVAVCTIERANVILTQLLDLGEEHRLRMVVVDELHLISDSRRGFLLEVLLAKVSLTSLHNVAFLNSSSLFFTSCVCVDKVLPAVIHTDSSYVRHPPQRGRPGSMAGGLPL